MSIYIVAQIHRNRSRPNHISNLRTGFNQAIRDSATANGADPDLWQARLRDMMVTNPRTGRPFWSFMRKMANGTFKPFIGIEIDGFIPLNKLTILGNYLNSLPNAHWTTDKSVYWQWRRANWDNDDWIKHRGVEGEQVEPEWSV